MHARRAPITRSGRSKNVVGNVTPIALARVAARDKCSIRHVNMTISLAFLVPNLVQAAVEGPLPRGIGVARLRDAPAE
jgi:site-specific DNA recombinase